MGIDFNMNFKVNKKYSYNGKEYNSLEEMPEDVKKIFEDIEKKISSSPNRIEEKSIKTIFNIEKNLPEKQTPIDTIDAQYRNVIQSAEEKATYWYYGILLVGLLFIMMGTFIGIRSIKAHLGVYQPASFFALVSIVLGVGIIAVKEWARISALMFIPFLGLTVFLYSRLLSNEFFLFMDNFASFLSLSFIYLLLPWVRKEFDRKK